MTILFYAIRALNLLFLITILLPLIKKDHWTFRVFEFPRLQKLAIGILLFSLTIWMLIIEGQSLDWGFSFLLLISLFYCASKIYPFTILSNKQVKSVGSKTDHADITILISNVYQYNREYDRLIKLVHLHKPDMVMMVETDKNWKEASVNGFGADYPYQILEDIDNTYGMLLFSKNALENVEIRNLIKEGIPSFKLDVVLENNSKLKFYGIHPEPPVPSENPYATARDAEILIVAKEIEKEEEPTLVVGDLNDVAWSYTTKLFLKTSGLLDPRRGRGFFNTFHAKHKLLRWPLDHIFCSKHFCVHSINRLPAIGSDHFPMLIGLNLTAHENNGQKLEEDKEDMKEVKEKIEAGR